MMVVDLALTVLTMLKIFKLKQDIQAVGQSKAGSLLSTMVRQSIHYYVAITALVRQLLPVLSGMLMLSAICRISSARCGR
jgi:hypothetical protein